MTCYGGYWMNYSHTVAIGLHGLRLLSAIWRQMPWLAAVWLAIPLLLGLLLVPSYAAQKELVDLFVNGAIQGGWKEKAALAWPPLAVIAGTAMLGCTLETLQNLIDARLRDRASKHIQMEVHQRAISVPLEQMDQPDYYDRLQRAKKAAGSDLLLLLHNVIVLVRYLFEWFGLLLVVWLIHPVIGLLLAGVCVISFAIRLESELAVRRLNRNLTRAGRQSDYLHEAVMKPETVKELRIFHAADFLIEKWRGLMRYSLQRRMDARRREIRHGIAVSAVQIAGLFTAIVWMVLQLGSGIVTAGVLVVGFQAIRQAYGLSSKIQHPVSKLYIQGTSIIDLAAYLEEAPLPPVDDAVRGGSTSNRSGHAIDDESSRTIGNGIGRTAALPGAAGRIVFEQVEYRYSGSANPTVHSLSLVLNPGETVALVGENGAGKSTLVKLLLGLYPPTKGRIRWDGVDYRELDPVRLSASMSAVFQDYLKFETTVRDNLIFGQQDHNQQDAALWEFLYKLGLADLVNKLGGLDARLGRLTEGGRELSGGQWQRLAIARAAFRDARLLVMDEPTAALDPLQEFEMYQAFRNMARGRTVLFVSHRLGWARYADRILVMKGGRVVEEGSHDQLVAAGKQYTAMFQSQAELWKKEDKPV